MSLPNGHARRARPIALEVEQNLQLDPARGRPALTEWKVTDREKAGDGAAITDETTLTVEGSGEEAEFLLFEMKETR